MSLIHYKFKAAKDYNSLTFDGLSISLFELKRDILIDNKLKGSDFDIIISNAQTNEDYYDDTQLIPKNTSVYVRRVPAKPGGTNAQQYLTAGAPVTAGGQSSKRIMNNRGGMNPLPVPETEPTELGLSMPLSLDGVLPGESEEDKLKALFDQSSMQWDQQLQPTVTSQNYKNYQGNSYRNAPPQGKPLSANYICHRCGIRGHYVQNCPTIGDKTLNQPKVRRTTGIPRSFLKNIDSIPEGKGAMITNDGALVVAQTNDAAWKKFQLNQRGSGFSAEELRESVPIPSGLGCSICNKLLCGAVSVPCCKKLFCHECISEELLNKAPASQFICPNCHARDIVPDGLIVEQKTRNQVDERLRLWAMEREGDLGDSDQENLIDRQENNDTSSSKFPDSEPQLFTPTTENEKSFEFNYGPGHQGDFGFHDSNLDSHRYNSDLGLEGQFITPPEPIPFEMPPLRWTPDGGISGHINIPPIEMLSNGGNLNSDFDHFAGRGRNRDRRDYRGSNQNEIYNRDRRNRHNEDRKRSFSPRRSPTPDRHASKRDTSRSGSYRRDRSASINDSRHNSRDNHSTYSQRNRLNEISTGDVDRSRHRNADNNYIKENRGRSRDNRMDSPPRRSRHSRPRSKENRSISPRPRGGRQSRSVSRTGKDSSTRRRKTPSRSCSPNGKEVFNRRKSHSRSRSRETKFTRGRRNSSRSRSKENRVALPKERKVRRSRSHSKNRSSRRSVERVKTVSHGEDSRQHRRDVSLRRSHPSSGPRYQSISPELRRSRNLDGDKHSKPDTSKSRVRDISMDRSKDPDSSRRHRSDDSGSKTKSSSRSNRDSDLHEHNNSKASYDNHHRSPIGSSHCSENRSDKSISIKNASSKRGYKESEEKSDYRLESSRRSPLRSSRIAASPSPNDNGHQYDDSHGGSDSRAPISDRLGKKKDTSAQGTDILSRIGPTRDRSLTSRIGGRVDLNSQSAEASQSKRRRNRNKSDRMLSPELPQQSIRIAHISKRS